MHCSGACKAGGHASIGRVIAAAFRALPKRFGLRSLFASFFLIGCVLACRTLCEQYHQHDAVVHLIDAIDDEMVVDLVYDDGYCVAGMGQQPPRARNWSEELRHSAHQLMIVGCTDEALVQVGRLRSLRMLKLDFTRWRIRNAGLSPYTPEEPRIQDPASFRHLAHLMHLERLGISGPATDARLFFAVVTKLKQLRHLSISGPICGDSEFQYLAAISNLKTLYIGDYEHEAITEENLPYLLQLKRLNNLEVLKISGIDRRVSVTQAMYDRLCSHFPNCEIQGLHIIPAPQPFVEDAGNDDVNPFEQSTSAPLDPSD